MKNKYYLIIAAILYLKINLPAAILYVDIAPAEPGSGWDGVNGHAYSGIPGEGFGYLTIQDALNAVAVGDIIYMRGGTYTEKGADPATNITLPIDKNGTSWTQGNFTTLTSYPGEWAVLDGQGSSNSGCVIGNAGSASTPHSNRVSYWKFERFEIRGGTLPGDESGGGAMRITEGPFWIRYMFFNGNIDDSAANNPCALQIYRPEECIIEYNYFYNNGCSGGGGYPSSNCQQIWMHSDYCDETNAKTCPEPVTDVYDITHATRKNIIRYNYFNGNNLFGGHGIKYKSRQLLGPIDGSTTIYKEYGDKIHHNIMLNHSESAVTLSQDYIQFYNNILDGNELGISMYNQHSRIRTCVYNNTLLSAPIQSWSNNDRTFAPWEYVYNNILDNTPSGTSYENRPFSWWPYTDDQICSGINVSNLKIDRNYLYRPESESNQVVMSGQVNCDGAEPLYGYLTLNQFNQSYSVNNYTKPSSEGTDDLMNGTAAADKYVTRGTHIITGSTTIADAGIGGSHPYLDDVTLPGYIGATKPDDNDWVAGVLGLNAAYFTNVANNSTPAWIEKTGSTQDAAMPNAPERLTVK